MLRNDVKIYIEFAHIHVLLNCKEAYFMLINVIIIYDCNISIMIVEKQEH